MLISVRHSTALQFPDGPVPLMALYAAHKVMQASSVLVTASKAFVLASVMLYCQSQFLMKD